MRMPKGYSAVTLVLLLGVAVAAFTAGRRTAEFDEITVKKITVVDEEGRARVLLAGGYGPRRADLAGLLFINQEGVEAGGLVYTGKRDSAGAVDAGAILTFDQFGNDQIDQEAILAKVASDPRLQSTEERCRVLRNMVQWSDALTPEELRECRPEIASIVHGVKPREKTA